MNYSLVINYLIVFFAAVLSFSVQLIVSKQMLPEFGGSASVWMISLFFFQITLLITYLSSYFFEKRISFLKGLVLFSILNILVGHMSINFESPFINVIFLLFVSTFFPFLTLSLLSPIIQKKESTNPYSFYIVSNLGCLIGVFSFPLVEFLFDLSIIYLTWKIFYIIICLVFLLKKMKISESDLSNKISIFNLNYDFWKWTFISFLSNGIFLGVTSLITTSLYNFSLIWSFSLGLFLLSFIISFNKKNLSKDLTSKAPLYSLFALMLASSVLIPILKGGVIFLYLGIMFIFLIDINSILSKEKPKDKKHLYAFYLAMSLGGVISGFFVNIIFPFLFNNLVDPFLFIFSFILFLFFYFPWKRENVINIGITTCLMSFCVYELMKQEKDVIYENRNFYGIIKVVEDSNKRGMIHSGVYHGLINLNSLDPQMYYSTGSGVDLAFREIADISNKNILAIGSGIGSVSYYTKSSDRFSVIEIDPEVYIVAKKYFPYLSNPKYRLIQGDGRVEFKKLNEKYDLIISDAFSGGSVPIHLLTVEAFDLYFSKLNQEGVIAVHTSNNLFDLDSVINYYCQEKNIHCSLIKTKTPYVSNWVLMKKNKFKIVEYYPVSTNKVKWTDQYSSIFPIIKIDK